MVEHGLGLEPLRQLSTEALKQELLRLTEQRDTDALGQKVQFFKDTLAPIFAELSTRNPCPNVAEQAALVIGVWIPIWSTIPFQDTIPGRLREQSYQIFHADGYYANVARYTPGNRLPLVKRMLPFLFAYDFMIVQKYQVANEQWSIQNVAIEQKLRLRPVPLNAERAEAWFTRVAVAQQNVVAVPNFENLDQRTAKRFTTIFQSTPQLEHLYIDPEFRLVKSQRSAKQRTSYTIAVRLHD